MHKYKAIYLNVFKKTKEPGLRNCIIGYMLTSTELPGKAMGPIADRIRMVAHLPKCMCYYYRPWHSHWRD